MGHRSTSPPATHLSAPRGTTSQTAALDAETAQAVAIILQGLANPSRLRILTALQAGPLSVGEIVEAVDMEQSAVSHQLKHLRDLGFTIAERQGRRVIYQLFDAHVLELIDEGLAHAEHLRLGKPDNPR